QGEIADLPDRVVLDRDVLNVDPCRADITKQSGQRTWLVRNRDHNLAVVDRRGPVLTSDFGCPGPPAFELVPQVGGCRRRLNSLDQHAELVLHTAQLLQYRLGVRSNNLLPEHRIAACDARHIAGTWASQAEGAPWN